MKKVIIGVHGLGNKPSKKFLKRWWKEALTEGLNLIGISAKLPRFELVYWADILYDIPLKRSIKDKNSPYFLDEPYTRAPKNKNPDTHSFRRKVVDFLAGQLKKIFLTEDNTLKYSCVTELILKRYFRDLEIYYRDENKDEKGITRKVRDLIRTRVAQTLEKYRDYQIMLIAHSMGSIITFDVLTFIVPEIKIDVFVTIGSPLGLPVVVSKIAAEQKRKLNGSNIMVTPPGVSSGWFNFTDILDNVALQYKLADEFSKNEQGVSPVDSLVSNNYEINGIKNPHKSFGYLRTPELSKVISDFMGEEKPRIGQKVRVKVQDIFKKVKKQQLSIQDKLKLNK
jgi:hypothetical protein